MVTSMRMGLRTRTFAYPWHVHLVAATALLAGCPGDDVEGETAAETEGESTGTGSTDATGSASMTTSASQSGTSTTGTSTSSTSDDTTAGSDGTSTTGVDETTGTIDECDGLPRNECVENEACAPISCNPFQEQMMGQTQWCLGDAAYIGCRAADLGCAEVRTVACGPEDDTVVCPDACIPSDYTECDPPVEGNVPMCG